MSQIQSREFVHLHVHTEYSLLDGIIRLKSLVQRAVEYGMTSVAITDHGNMFGVVNFYKEALKAGIKPIIGCECYLAPRTMADKTPQDHEGLSHLVLLAENMEGYQHLCRLVTLSSLKGFYHKPRIDKDMLRQYGSGLIGLSACLKGEVPQLLMKGRIDEADAAARSFCEIFGEDRFFLEVQNNGIPQQETLNQALKDMSQRLSIPLVGTNDCHYLEPEDSGMHELFLCLQTGKTIYDPDRMRFDTDQLNFKSGREMRDFLEDFPQAADHTVEIAERCNVELDFKTLHFPRFETPDDKSIEDYFEEKVWAGLEKRKKSIQVNNPEADDQAYKDRLDYEISVIKNMEFPGYFMIVSDFIEFAKNDGIPIGPGRGSAAGSLVSYCLNITDLDPIEHGLLFERFLNPERKSMPDIDVDICINGRERVYKYLVEKYGGDEYVAHIITFGSMKSRAAIRDVGRVLDIPLYEVDPIAKLIPNDSENLEDALAKEPALRDMIASKPEFDQLMKAGRALEGLPRHASTHAAGVVIGDRPLSEYLPLYSVKEGEVSTQFDMKCVETIGLVKLDLLGLRNLTVIQGALNLIEKQGQEPPDMSHLKLDDEGTYQLLSRGDTTGVFQLESSGMKELLVKMKPAMFPDIVALVALYRPGPLGSGMIEDFIERKHGRKKAEYLTPELEPILKETHGVILYQEQVMKIAQTLGGYSMGSADDLRKAMGKKIKEKMAEHSDIFVSGAVKNGIKENKARDIYAQMEYFGGYGFNKSHSAAYALIAYQTAYLKAHFPVEFMAALLTSAMPHPDDVVKFIAECRTAGIEILPPDINESEKRFTVVDGRIRFGLLAVKNVGEAAIEVLVEERQNNGPYVSLFDFCERVSLAKVNKKVVESLIKCGAFDSTGAERARMMAAVEDALSHGQTIQRERADAQMTFFDLEETETIINAPVLPEIPEWSEKQRLAFEKESLGFYVTGHPLSNYKDQLARYANADSVGIREMKDKAHALIGGTITTVNRKRTKKDQLMADVVIEDIFGPLRVIVFPTLFKLVADLLVEDAPVFVEGTLEKSESTISLQAERIVPIEKAHEAWQPSVHCTIDAEITTRETLSQLKAIFDENTGTCKGFLHLTSAGGQETVIALPETLKLSPGTVLSDRVDALLGYKSVRAGCQLLPAAEQWGIKRKPRRNGFRGNGGKRF